MLFIHFNLNKIYLSCNLGYSPEEPSKYLLLYMNKTKVRGTNASETFYKIGFYMFTTRLILLSSYVSYEITKKL